jgi:hypothetical protein
VPFRVDTRGVALAIVVGLATGGCNATCIRDSDCLGQSMCSENRCILLVGRDASRGSSSDDGADDNSSASDASTAASPDAGN